MNWYNIEESNMEDYQNYIEKYFIEDGVEYEGFVKNTHPSQKLYVKCWIDNDYGGYTRFYEVEPQGKTSIMFHNCGPIFPWENQYDFEILEISNKPFSD